MRVQFSPWYAWEDRQDIPNINESGVYVIGRRVNRNVTPDLCSKRIVYVGYTEKLSRRLTQFERSCQGEREHAGGISFFEAHICRDFRDRVDRLHAKKGLSRRDATKRARSEANFVGRKHEFAETWQRKKQSLSVAVWVPCRRWKTTFKGLPKREQLKFVEAKLQVDFVRKNKKLPKFNKTFG